MYFQFIFVSALSGLFRKNIDQTSEAYSKPAYSQIKRLLLGVSISHISVSQYIPRSGFNY